MRYITPFVIERIFKFANLKTCVNLHKAFNVRKYIWRKKMRRLYNKHPEKLIFSKINKYNVVFGCICSGIDKNITNFMKRLFSV